MKTIVKYILLTIFVFNIYAQQGVIEEWVRHYASGLVPSDDKAIDMVMDSSGNLYVTGYSTSAKSIEYYTVKYDSSGVIQWTARYSGGSDNRPSDIEIDGQGNVYVTGYSYNPNSSKDYATVKYDAAGAEQWTVLYNGPGNGEDESNALTVDDQGNVYVTGKSYSDSSVQSGDYATVKYNSAGLELWVARYNGPDDLNDGAVDIDVDSQGSVFVTGSSRIIGYGPEYATVKYDAMGNEQWIARFDGPGGSSTNYAVALTLDDEGNLYVTGWSDGYTTIKYNTNGSIQWTANYYTTNGTTYRPTALALDNYGNVYVTGKGNGADYTKDYTTVKYNSAGVEQWATIYSSPGNVNDQPNALVVDSRGNVYVSGYSHGVGYSTPGDYATVKYDSTGIEQWVSHYNGPGNGEDEATALAIDSQGNVYVSGSSVGMRGDHDYSTIKYDSSGAEQWVIRYNGPGSSSDYAKDIALNDQGNIYVTGSSERHGTFTDYTTVNYDVTGVEQWVVRYNGPGNGRDEANAIEVDDQGNVYVTGSSEGSDSGYDFATVKYSTAGVEQWVARYNGPGDSTDHANALKVDNQGNVYVTGYTVGSGTGKDFTTVKYDYAGVEQWIKRYNGPGNGDDFANAIEVDDMGNVYVTGTSEGSGSRCDFATVKYNAAGNEDWIMRYNSSDNSNDFSNAMVMDSEGNVYITGSGGNGTGGACFTTVKYSSAGIERWVAHFTLTLGDQANSIAVDDSGNVFITGTSSVYDIFYQCVQSIATVKYDSSGVEQWFRHYGLYGHPYWATSTLAIDNQSNVYVTGYDYITSKYDAAGGEKWMAHFDYGFGQASAIALDNQGDIYVSGTSVFAGVEELSVYTTIKYQQKPTGFDQQILSNPINYELKQNYPNPFNPSTVISWQVEAIGRSPVQIDLSIYNILGQKVATLVSGKQKAGFHSVEWNASEFSSGVYYYQLLVDDPSASSGQVYREVKKMILIK